MPPVKLELNTAEIQKKLERLESELHVKAVRAGLVKFAAPIKKTAKQLAPKDEGSLAKAIGHRALTKRQAARIDLFEGGSNRVSVNNPEVAIIVGPNRKINGYNQAFKGTLIEFGVKKKWRHYKKARLKGFPGYQFGGIKGTYFMKRSLAQNEGRAEDLFFKGVASYLKRIDK